MNCQRLLSLLLVGCLGSCLAWNIVLAKEQEDRELPALTVGAGADLVLTSISGPMKAFLNQTISVTFRVTNQGDEDSGAYQVGLYLSKDMTIDPANGRLLKEITFPSGVPAGQTRKTTIRVAIPASGLSGLYYYGGVVGSSSYASLKKVSIVRFEVDSLNGTVTDHRTALMWQQTDDGVNRTWAEAKTYCNGLVLGGHEDWHVPSIDQLLTIVDYSRYSPAIDPVFDCRLHCYWSSTTYAGFAEGAWFLFFGSGYSSAYDKNHQDYVRCVRGGPW
jgi:hypothetical protein